MRATSVFVAATVAGLTVGGALADHPESLLSQPGYRPPAEGDAAELFCERAGDVSITVLPTAVRTREGTFYDQTCAKSIATSATAAKVGTATAGSGEVALGETAGCRGQYDLFQKGLAQLCSHVADHPVESQYVLLVEFLVTAIPSGGQAVGGIHCYVVDNAGKNAFSFLLNSHHRLFAEGKLRSGDASEQARAKLVQRSGEVVVEALRQQISQAKAKGGGEDAGR